ncbi:hypothetical protein SDC9_89253 [bioreactor metagenome]|uniref:Uncharacterized protein n=1 Tax=bioreactor metagenome TaxID=1076179 RepID=A0A644ZPB8_9ZZZZ
MYVGFDHRAVLVCAVVVGGDAACAVVHALAHRRVAQVGQVVGLGAVGQGGIFHLHKVADVHFAPQLRAGAQSRERADQCALAHAGTDLFAVDVSKRMDHRVCRNGGVADVAVRADARARADFHHAGEDAAYVDLHILRAIQLGQHAAARVVAQIEAGRISQAHALLH